MVQDKHGNEENSRKTYDYSTYKDKDMNALTSLQKEILMTKISGKTHSEIAKALKISAGCVGVFCKRREINSMEK